MVPTIERRACPRFTIPGALVRYQKSRLFGKRTEWDEQSCRLFDLSRGGVRFLSKESPPLDAKVDLELTVPEEKNPLRLAGISRWVADHQGDEFRYFVGVQFNPYGNSRKHNPLESLDQIIGLENLFLRT